MWVSRVLLIKSNHFSVSHRASWPGVTHTQVFSYDDYFEMHKKSNLNIELAQIF